MAFFSIREKLAHVAIAVLLAAPATAAPSPLMGRACLANIVSDLSCADSSIMTRCVAIERVDAELLATCLEAAGCTEDEAENALWITEKCQVGSTSGHTTDPDLEGELRRRFHARSNNKRADSTTTTSEESTTATATSTSSSSSETSSSTSTSTSSSATSTTSATSTSSSSTTSTSTTSTASATSTSTSSYADLDIGLSSAIVGSVMGIAAAAAFGGVFICAWREGAAKRKAKREAAQKEALMSNMG